MNQEQIVAFLKALGTTQIRVKDNGWVEASCPLAPWLHQKHVDSSPSFGMAIKPGERSYFSCFACRSGSAEELLQTLELYTKDSAFHLPKYDFKLCHELLESMPEVQALPEYGEFAQPGHTFVEWPQYWLDSFLPVWNHTAAYSYLMLRNVSNETMTEFQLKYDTKRQMIVAPYYDVFGRLAGARGRSVVPGVLGLHKHFDYSFQNQNNCRLVWYHESVLNLPGPAVVVEGQFDCMRTAQVYPKVVANLSSKPTLEKMKKLGDCPFIIQIPDRDEAGQQSTVRYMELCGQVGIGYKMLWLDDGVKDPDECHVGYLKERIESLL